MVFLSLVPQGIYQAYHSVTTGFWYARSPEIVHSPVMAVEQPLEPAIAAPAPDIFPPVVRTDLGRDRADEMIGVVGFFDAQPDYVELRLI